MKRKKMKKNLESNTKKIILTENVQMMDKPHKKLHIADIRKRYNIREKEKTKC